MHVDLNFLDKTNALLQTGNKSNKLSLQDPMPALVARIEERINALPSDDVARELLHNSLASLSVSEALAAGRNKFEDGTTEIVLKKSASVSGQAKLIDEPHRVFVDTLSRRVNDGLAKGESVEDLTNLLDSASEGSTSIHSEVREILSAVGKLDPSTENYINRSESYVRFGLEQESAKFGDSEQLFDFDGKSDKSLNFTVTTNDGDEIQISLSFNTDKRASDLTYGKAVSLHYEIDGDIDFAEHQAFNELLSAVAASSDALLNGAKFDDLIGLEEFDATQLQGFDLSLGTDTQNGALTKNYYNYSYTQDGKTQDVNFTHHADFTVNSRTLQSKMSLHSNLGGAYDEAAIKSLLSVVEQAEGVAQKSLADKKNGHESDSAGNSIISASIQTFFKTAERLGQALDTTNQYLEESVGLAKNMFEQLSEHDPRYQGLESTEKDRLKQGFSQLADHQIKYQQSFTKSDINAYSPEKENKYSVSFDQHTSQRDINTLSDEAGNHVEQTRKYKAEALKSGGAVVRGNIVNDVWRAEEEYSINLLSAEGKVIGLDQQREREEFRDIFTYLGGGQYSRREEKEAVSSSSEIRNIENLWAEKLAFEHQGYQKLGIYNGRRPQDIDTDQIFGEQFYQQFEQLTLIGDIKKLNDDLDYRMSKFKELSTIDLVMKGQSDTINFEV